MSIPIVLLKEPSIKNKNKKSIDILSKAHYNIELTHKAHILLIESNDKLYCINSRYTEEETKKIVKFPIHSFFYPHNTTRIISRADAVKYNF